jgi:hypothetical protein
MPHKEAREKQIGVTRKLTAAPSPLAIKDASIYLGSEWEVIDVLEMVEMVKVVRDLLHLPNRQVAKLASCGACVPVWPSPNSDTS